MDVLNMIRTSLQRGELITVPNMSLGMRRSARTQQENQAYSVSSCPQAHSPLAGDKFQHSIGKRDKAEERLLMWLAAVNALAITRCQKGQPGLTGNFHRRRG